MLLKFLFNISVRVCTLLCFAYNTFWQPTNFPKPFQTPTTIIDPLLALLSPLYTYTGQPKYFFTATQHMPNIRQGWLSIDNHSGSLGNVSGYDLLRLYLTLSCNCCGMPNSPRGGQQHARFSQRILLGGSNTTRICCVVCYKSGKPNSL